MKLIEFRYVLRDQVKVLQVRHRALWASPDGIGINYQDPERRQWSDWEDVPTVEERKLRIQATAEKEKAE